MNKLRTKIIILLLFVVASSLTVASYALAESAIQCHCFKDRSFNPADTFASDDYILATSFNSLLANFFNIQKRTIIMVKMNEGVSHNDLLIALKISRITGVDLRKYLELRKANKTWVEIITGLSDVQEIKQNLLLQAVKSGLSADEAGDRIGDEVIWEFYNVAPEKITALRKSGLDNKEMALVFILVHLRGVKPDSLVQLNRKQGKSWSEIAFHLGIQPAEAGRYILAFPEKELPE